MLRFPHPSKYLAAITWGTIGFVSVRPGAVMSEYRQKLCPGWLPDRACCGCKAIEHKHEFRNRRRRGYRWIFRSKAGACWRASHVRRPRGANLDAIQQNGFKLSEEDGTERNA